MENKENRESQVLSNREIVEKFFGKEKPAVEIGVALLNWYDANLDLLKGRTVRYKEAKESKDSNKIEDARKFTPEEEKIIPAFKFLMGRMAAEALDFRSQIYDAGIGSDTRLPDLEKDYVYFDKIVGNCWNYFQDMKSASKFIEK